MPEVQLRVIINGEILDAATALREARRDTVEAFLQSLVLLPLEPEDLYRIQLGACFRDALQSPRPRKPFNIESILKTAKQPGADSLESRIFEQGQARGLIGFAAAAKENKQVVEWIQKLDDRELRAFLKSTTLIDAHIDFVRIVQNVDHKVSVRPHRISDKPKHVPRPRSWKSSDRVTAPSPGRAGSAAQAEHRTPRTSSDKPRHGSHSEVRKLRTTTFGASNPHVHWHGGLRSPDPETHTRATGNANALGPGTSNAVISLSGLSSEIGHDGAQATSPRNALHHAPPPQISADFMSAPRTDLFDAESVMMQDFDKSFDSAMAVNTFEASRIMSVDFDAWQSKPDDPEMLP